MPKPYPTVDRIRELLAYNPDTGALTWRVKRSTNAPAGALAGTLSNAGKGKYFSLSVDNVRFWAHRIIWLHFYGRLPINTIDHIDGNRLNNKIENLRDIPHAINNQNIRKITSASSTGLLGVTRYQHKLSVSYMASININGRKKYLGSYPTPEEAHRVYLDAKRTMHVGCTI